MPDTTKDINPAPAETTRAALISAALALFGSKGYAATSTRELARLANTNVASIAYHFGGKEGLYNACGEEFARRISATLQAGSADLPVTKETAGLILEKRIRALAIFMNGGHHADDLVGFMLRQLAEQGPVLDQIYKIFIEPRHKDFCELWALATDQDAESDTVKLSVFTLLGQILYFRIGRGMVCNRMDWSEIGMAEAEKIAEVVVGNLHKLLASGEKP